VLRFDRSVTTMSTLTTSQSSRDGADLAPRGRLISGRLALLFLSTFGTLTSFYLLVSVTPMYAASAGAGSAGAGLMTGVLLLGTVAAELASSFLMRRYGYRLVLAAGAILLGVPGLALLTHGPLIILVIASVIRGFGFGLGTVVMGALMAVLLPADRRGEGLGVFGLADTVPAVIALPSGVWLAGHFGYPVVVIITAVTALVPLAACKWLPGRSDAGAAPASDDAGKPTGLLAGLRHGGLLRPALIFAASTVAAGVVVSFLPLAAGVSRNVAAVGLLAQALTAAVTHWWAGWRGDRHGHARLLIPGLVIAALGMITMIWLASPVAMIAGMCLFGAGFGISQNATFVLMIDRMPASEYGTASAIWSLAYDAGYGAGPAVFGLVATRTGFPAAFALTGALMLVVLPTCRRERSANVAAAAHDAPR
jgi:predicted MFS family arabinose efflux permease